MIRITKKTFWVLFVVALLVAVWAYVWYRTTLNRSIQEWALIESRAVQTKVSDRSIAPSEQGDAMPEPFMEEVLEVWSWSFNRLDPIHWAEWTVNVTQEWEDVLIEFSEEFRVANGPDLYVLLSSTEEYDQDTSLNLWTLVSKEWRQMYMVSSQEWEQYGEYVMIWCRAFDVTFSVAEV